MMAANYQHIGGHENRLGRHYSRFSAFWSPADLTDQSLALRKSQNAGSNGRSRVSDGAMARVEVITGPERRRRWTEEQKRAIIAQSLEPGAVIAEVARQAEVCPGQ